MAQTLNIPIRFRFVKVLTKWEIRTIGGKHQKPDRFAFGTLIPDEMSDRGYPTELNGWRCRDDFFKLPQTDEAFMGFLARVGVFASDSRVVGHYSTEFMQHCRENNPTPFRVDAIWKLRDRLKEILLDHKRSPERYSPDRPLSKRLSEFVSELGAHSDFLLRFDLGRVPVGEVTITDGLQMLLATVFTDLVRGLRFKYCARADCGRLFPVKSRHKRKYCCQPCGHLESVRKQRREEKRKPKTQIGK